MQQLQTREISANDYDQLLKLDEHRNKCNNKNITQCKFCELDDEETTEESKENPLKELNCKLINYK